MSQWDIYYKKTLDTIHNNIRIFEKILIFYYKLLIIDKLEDREYIKREYTKYIEDINLFNELFLETQNLAIFTIFNNIPDIMHPLPNDIYMDYGCYISFIEPKNKNDDIISLKHNLFKYQTYYYPLLYQDTAPYNYNKKYIFINIKYFDFDKYKKDYCIIFMTKNKDIYCYVNGIYKIKNKNKWNEINDFNIKQQKLLYVSVLRKISQQDIFNVFNKDYILNKHTKIYSYHGKKRDSHLYWFSLKEDEYLNDPYKIFYKQGDIMFKHICESTTDMKCINLSIDILSNNNINKTENIDDLLDNIYNKKNIDKKYTNKIYNGNLNKILSKSDINKIWTENKGKRLLNEIILKTSNFYNEKIYYFDFLEKYNINSIINSFGYYEKLDKFYSYELGLNDKSSINIKLIKTEEVKIL